MDTKMVQKLESLGCTVVIDRYVVVDDGEKMHDLDDDGNPRVNRDKNGQIQDVFCVLPRGRAIRVFHSGSRASLKSKISGNTPDITMEETNAAIFGRPGL